MEDSSNGDRVRTRGDCLRDVLCRIDVLDGCQVNTQAVRPGKSGGGTLAVACGPSIVEADDTLSTVGSSPSVLMIPASGNLATA